MKRFLSLGLLVILSLGFTLAQTDFGIATNACSDKFGSTQSDQLLVSNSSDQLPSVWLCPRSSGG